MLTKSLKSSDTAADSKKLLCIPFVIWTLLVRSSSILNGVSRLSARLLGCLQKWQINNCLSVMLAVINGNMEAHLCNQANERCEVEKKNNSPFPKSGWKLNTAAEKFEGVNQIIMCELLICPRPTMIMFGQIWMARTLLSAAVWPERLPGLAAAVLRVDISPQHFSSSHECEDITFHLLWLSHVLK